MSNEKIEVIGFFVDGDGEKTEAKDVFVAINEDANRYGDKTIYCPIGQHGCASLNYMREDCEEITKEEYMNASKLFYTPQDYLN